MFEHGRRQLERLLRTPDLTSRYRIRLQTARRGGRSSPMGRFTLFREQIVKYMQLCMRCGSSCLAISNPTRDNLRMRLHLRSSG